MTIGGPRKRQRVSPTSAAFATTTSAGVFFNDPSTADVILRLFVEPSPLEPNATATSPDALDSASSTTSDEYEDVEIYLHSHVLRRSKYFSALLSDRWQHRSHGNKKNISDLKPLQLKLGVPPTPGSLESHITVLQLLYSSDLSNSIGSASIALDILPVALELLFEDCVKSCVHFLEAVPWTEDEEKRVLSLIPFLKEEESKDLLARVLPGQNESCEEMLHGLVISAINNYPNMAFVKAFVAKLLRDFSSGESAKRVLERAFETSLKVVKESLEEYSSPNFRGDHNETEAIQRLNLHTAMTNGRHLLWLVERMIELRVADTAVKEWSDQAAFTADLQRAFRDDAWRNIVPGLPAVVLRCTSKLANAVAAGTILATRQVLLTDLLLFIIIVLHTDVAISHGLFVQVSVFELVNSYTRHCFLTAIIYNLLVL